MLARAAGNLPHQGDEPYTAEPPPVAGTLCMLLLLSRSRGALLVHACMSSAMRFPYGFPSILVFQHLGYYLKGVTNHWTANHWTGLLDSPKMMQNAFFSLFQCRREANHVYSAYLFAKFAPLAC